MAVPAAVESPSHLRTRARTMPDVTTTLLAALLAAPDGTVREVVFPAVRGGEQTMI
ncbi:hypothetical protein [Nonomuraea sp. NPDC049141]|uniref:hypothetical protein n=1 Tax=Nonomuraea sp. NPDC049141 TaxID=3155500 RepID=UPI003402BBF4